MMRPISFSGAYGVFWRELNPQKPESPMPWEVDFSQSEARNIPGTEALPNPLMASRDLIEREAQKSGVDVFFRYMDGVHTFTDPANPSKFHTILQGFVVFTDEDAKLARALPKRMKPMIDVVMSRYAIQNPDLSWHEKLRLRLGLLAKMPVYLMQHKATDREAQLFMGWADALVKNAKLTPENLTDTKGQPTFNIRTGDLLN